MIQINGVDEATIEETRQLISLLSISGMILGTGIFFVRFWPFWPLTLAESLRLFIWGSILSSFSLFLYLTTRFERHKRSLSNTLRFASFYFGIILGLYGSTIYSIPLTLFSICVITWSLCVLIYHISHDALDIYRNSIDKTKKRLRFKIILDGLSLVSILLGIPVSYLISEISSFTISFSLGVFFGVPLIFQLIKGVSEIDFYVRN